MEKNKQHKRTSLLQLVILILILTWAKNTYAIPKKHTIFFGGALGFHYSPDNLEVIVGDTIEWSGDFTKYGLESVSVPSGASSFKADSVLIFQYVVRKQGIYSYRNPIYFSVGMQGTILVDTVKYGLTNEGREFLLGMPIQAPLGKYFYVYAMINSYYWNDVSISYYDSTGQESIPVIYHVTPKSFLQIPLNASKITMDTSIEAAAFKACHITSKMPITVECFLDNTFGETYLSLPFAALGKKYVIASFNDNPSGGGNSRPIGPCGGAFLIIAAEDGTVIQITPTTTTVGGHPGVITGGGSTGIPQPYIIQLNKAQCYLVRSNGRDDVNDISGSIVQATRPIIVVAAHQEASLGSTFPGGNSLLEQMIPYEYWDSTGYFSIPFVEPNPRADEGNGDMYRFYSYDSVGFTMHVNVTGISGGYDLPINRFAFPQLIGIEGNVETSTPNGHKISVVQYDQRRWNVANKNETPAPCMMSIVPKSRWKKFYSFVIPNYPAAHNYLNIITSHFEATYISAQGLAPVPITSLTRVHLFGNISSQDNSLFGAQYKISIPSISTLSFPYYVYSEYPFALNYYQILSNNGAYYEYAAPAGMQLNTGVAPSFNINIDSSNCTLWHFCVSDTSKTDSGIKSIMLIDDPDGVYFEPGEQYKNVSFDTTLTYMPNELRPQGVKQYCFDVSVLNPLQNAIAPVAIVDNGGNAVVINLFKSAPPLKLFTTPATVRPDSIVYPVKKIGEQICTTFVLKNSAKIGGTAITLNSALLTNKDTSYKVISISPSLPHSIAAQDSVNVQVCYTPADSSRHRDSLILRTDCFSIAISLDAHGSTGLIDAADLDFAAINAGDTLCKTLQVRNVGSASFTLTGFALSDTINYTVTSSLPVQIKPGNFILMNICFHPKTEGSYSASIDWTTDLEASFAHSIKSHSALSGVANPKAGVKAEGSAASFSIHPNPANGNSIVVRFSSGRIPASEAGETLIMFDVLGREVYHQNIISGISEIEIPIRNLSEGVYYIKLGSVTQKFVKTK